MTGGHVGGRLVRIDALRGVASLAVLFFHLMRNSPQTHVLVGSAPGVLVFASDLARSGVAIFFVISGFVIGYSTRTLPATARTAGRFALRRQLRLDPPYYVVIAGVLVVEALQSRFGLVALTFTPSDVVLNLLYLQGITNTPSILAVAWTLCLEVQFYLVVMILALVAARWPGGRAVAGPLTGRGRSVFRVTVLLTGLLSLATSVVPVDAGGWFIGTWWMFALGLVLSWYLAGEVSARYVVGCIAVVCLTWLALQLSGAQTDPWGGRWFAVATAALIAWWIYSGGIVGPAPRLLVGAGTLSYSLYLVHLPFITYVMGGLLKVTGSSGAAAWASYLVGLFGSLGAAWLLYRLVERRSLRWSRAVRLRSAPQPTPDSAPTGGSSTRIP